MPLGAFATLAVTTGGTSGAAVAHGFIDRPAAMADEPVRMPPVELPRLAAYDPPPVVAWPPGWQRQDRLSRPVTNAVLR